MDMFGSAGPDKPLYCQLCMGYEY